MSQRQNEQALLRQNERRNQKNIYVHKIKSLMRISHDTLLQDEKDISVALNKKQFKKVRSQGIYRTNEVDKAAIKLQKNRESAKRARLRKKLYIKLLEKRVQKLRDAAEEGSRIEKDCQKFVQMIHKKEGKAQKREQLGDDIEKYLSRQNLSDRKRTQYQKEESFARMDKLAEQICQVSMCSSLRNIRELSSQISLEEIIKSDKENQRQLQGEELQDIIKDVLLETENLRNSYVDIMNQNEVVKRSVTAAKNQLRYQPHNSNGQRKEEKGDSDKGIITTNQFCSFFERTGEPISIFINLTEGERIIIQGWSYLEQLLNEDEQI